VGEILLVASAVNVCCETASEGVESDGLGRARTQGWL
jgi:hypothetical protein